MAWPSDRDPLARLDENEDDEGAAWARLADRKQGGLSETRLLDDVRRTSLQVTGLWTIWFGAFPIILERLFLDFHSDLHRSLIFTIAELC
jgi:hypothetical protein